MLKDLDGGRSLHLAARRRTFRSIYASSLSLRMRARFEGEKALQLVKQAFLRQISRHREGSLGDLGARGQLSDLPFLALHFSHPN